MKYRLLNVMEDRVIRVLDDTLPQLGCCTCDRCKADVATYTLSRIQPNYIAVPEEGPFEIPADLGADYDSQILQTIVQAAGIVSQKPNHE